MKGRDLLLQLKRLNDDCEKALEEGDFVRLKALMLLKKDLLSFLGKASFDKEDLPLVHEALNREEELASLVLAKRASLKMKVSEGWLH